MTTSPYSISETASSCKDELLAMMIKERQSYNYQQYVSTHTMPMPMPMSTDRSSSLIDIRDEQNLSRLKICHWTFHLIDYFDLSRNTATISMDIFDRFMATQGHLCTANFTVLAAAASVYISIKLHEHSDLKSTTLSRFSRGEFTASDIEAMECEILKSISWLVHPPTANCFLCMYVEFFPHEMTKATKLFIYENAKYLTELSVFDSYFVDHRASTVSYAAIKCVLDGESSSRYLSLEQKRRILFNIKEKFGLLSNNHDFDILTTLVEQRLYQAIAKYQDDDGAVFLHSNQSKRTTSNNSPISTLHNHRQVS